jgi:Domain of unknown function (DUF1840)
MIYRFRSPATGDVVMLGAAGDELLRLLGREPSAKGIVEPAAMPAAIERLQAAVQAAEAPAEPAQTDEVDASARTEGVSLRQRVWPMIEMLRRAHAAGEPVVWGV